EIQTIRNKPVKIQKEDDEEPEIIMHERQYLSIKIRENMSSWILLISIKKLQQQMNNQTGSGFCRNCKNSWTLNNAAKSACQLSVTETTNVWNSIRLSKSTQQTTKVLERGWKTVASNNPWLYDISKILCHEEHG
ncbi:hypothetical protein CEXT_38541, partial [Caerostris extrusa]